MIPDNTLIPKKRKWARRGQTVRQAVERLGAILATPVDQDTMRGFIATLKPRVAAVARAWNLACRVPGAGLPSTPARRMDEQFRSRILALWSLCQDLEEASRMRQLPDPGQFLANIEWLRGDLLSWLRAFQESGRAAG